MLSPRRLRFIAAALLVSVFGLGAVLPSHAQQATRRTLAQMNLLVIPEHHQQIYFTYGIASCNPSQGKYITFQLNNTGDSCPETRCIPTAWLKCDQGTVAALGAGTASGTVVSRPLPGGWTAYVFTVQVTNAYTQFFDAAQQAKVADGFSRLSFQVSYDLYGLLEQIPIDFKSILGPVAHRNDPAFQALGQPTRNFSMKMSAQGSGQVTVTNPASWELTNVFLRDGTFGVGSLNLAFR